MATPSSFEDVGAAALRGGRSVAVLADGGSGAGCDQRCHHRHVDRVRSVTAGPHDVEAARTFVVGERHERRLVQRRLQQPGEFVDALTLRPQGDEKASDLRGRRITAQDRRHHRSRRRRVEIATGDQRRHHGWPVVEWFAARHGPQRTCRVRGGEVRSGDAAALADHPPTVTLGRPAPHAGLLAERQRVVETRVLHVASGADGLGGLGALIVVGIEERRVQPAACSEIPPFQFL